MTTMLAAVLALLTAAHCLIQFGGSTDVSQVRIGSLDRMSGGEVRQAAEFHTHPEFNDGKAPLGDIALIRLSAPVSATPVAPAGAVSVGSRLRLLGWGVDCANPNGCGRELPRLLNQVDVIAVDAARCAPGRGEDITEICHDNPGGADACTFDSGGPALLDGRLAGVASRDGSGPECGDGTGIYTSVSAYRDFIDKALPS